MLMRDKQVKPNDKIIRRRLRVVVAMAVLGVATAAIAATANAATPDKPGPAAATLDQFHADLRAGKTTAALELLAPDVFIIQQGFINRGRAQYAGSRIVNDVGFAKAVSTQRVHRDVLKISPTAAEVVTQMRRKGKFHGVDVDLIQAETALVEKRDGVWRIVAIHWSGHQGHTQATKSSPSKSPSKSAP